MKNLIFDIGGIIINDSKENLANLLNINVDEIKKYTNICYGGTFKECLLGNLKLNDHIIEAIKKKPDSKEEIKFILSPSNFNKTIPFFEDNINQIYKLKDKGYNIYFLSNITKETFDYINNIKTIFNDFCGGIYSFQEHCCKPNEKIYLMLLHKYNLDFKETIFFDDKEKNIYSANKIGIKGVLFKTFDDVINNV